MLDFYEVKNSLPPEFQKNLVEKNHREFLSREISIVILDDDPTGTQTLYDVPVLTGWGKDDILDELTGGTPVFFILTNSRSLNSSEADSLAVTIGENIKYASDKSGRKVIVVSRGDSTLRGHYPNEVNALGRGLGIPDAPHILIPALFQAGRHTVNDMHYVREGNFLIPAGETPFARDLVFGYRSSDLKKYVEEKTGGLVMHKDVVSVSLDQIRLGGTDAVSSSLSGLKPNQVCIVNAFAQSDLDVFSAGLFKSFTGNCHFLFRTAASFLNSLAGMPPKDLLEPRNINLQGTGGLVVIGSYVPKTTRQLAFLKKSFDADYIEINVSDFLTTENFENEIHRVAGEMNISLKKGRITVIFTNRELVRGNNSIENMRIINKVSEGIVKIVQQMQTRPRFVISKGGITSSDILNKSFGVKKAQVTGQIISAVPVWKLDDCKSFPGLACLPFPGNLGDDDALFNAVIRLIE